MNLKRWVKIGEKKIFQNDHWTYNLDQFEIENGFKGEYHYVHTLGSTMVIPVTEDKNFLLVNQFRYLNQRESLEFPCGSIEPHLTEEDNALKELREESGHSAKNLIKVGEFSPYTGASDEMCRVFIGYDLYPSPLQHDETEEFIIVEKSYDEIDELIRKNIIWDGLTLSSWLLAQTFLKQLMK